MAVHKDSRKIRSRVIKAFNYLRENESMVTEINFLCCGSCASGTLADIAGNGFKGFAYYHGQDNDALNKEGRVYIGHGPNKKVAKKIVSALVNAGLVVEWDGDIKNRILVHL